MMIQVKEVKSSEYKEGDLLNIDLLINVNTLYLKSLRTFSSSHPTLVVVTFVQFYILIIMLMLHSDWYLILCSIGLIVGYIMGGVAVIMDNTTNEYLKNENGQ